MKRLIFFVTIGLLLFLNPQAWSQDFIVNIPSTDNYSSYIKPLKAGESIQFQITVKNNRTDTCTVSIDKNAMGFPGPWVTIDITSQVLFPQQSTTFLLTLSIPLNTDEGQYAMPLYFNAYDKTGFNHSFTYNTQMIIIDYSVPSIPSFFVYPSSTTVYVTSWSSYDALSAIYTMVNSSSGEFGIKSYTITLKKS